VDASCIDCATCMWMCPSVFRPVNGASAVVRQPEPGSETRMDALRAILACPTGSIRTETSPKDMKDAIASVPHRVANLAGDWEEGDAGVYHSCYHSERSYGATPWLIVLARDRGVVMVDSPRFHEPLAKKIEARFGGVDAMILTHKDDVCDHDAWARRFGCSRIMHESDVGSRTREVEVKLEGSGPWKLSVGERNDGPGATATDLGRSGGDRDGEELLLIHTPGHTAGCVCLLYTPESESEADAEDEAANASELAVPGALFTGDHVSGKLSGELTAHPTHNWHDWDLQRKSVASLVGLRFTSILPGHGAPAFFENVREKDAALNTLLAREP